MASRPNLHILLKAHVLKIDLTDAVLPRGKVRARGVVFVCDGEQYEVKVKKEVHLCAGMSAPTYRGMKELRLGIEQEHSKRLKSWNYQVI